MPEPSRSIRLYRWLLRLYPATFYHRYSGPMERAFRDELSETTGIWGLARIWFRLLADLSSSVPSQVMHEAIRDGRHALRLWTMSPWQTGLAVSALAIGIGGATGGFSVVHTLLRSSLPFHDPDNLVVFHPNDFIPPHDSAAQFHEWRERSAYLSAAALVEDGDVNLGGSRETVRAHAAYTSWNFFETLGAGARMGRTFTPGEDSPGRNSVAVIGWGLWQNLYAGDPNVLGREIRTNGKKLTIIGVAPPGFDYPNKAVLWQPAPYSPGNNGWTTVARLKSGISWPQAVAAFHADVDRLQPAGKTHRGARPSMRRLREALMGSSGRASLLLMAGTMLVLLIACTNTANLMMARTAGRAPEFSIRSALGANRARLMQQLVTESLILAAVAGIAGFLVAAGITSIAARVQPLPLAAMSYSILDGRVFTFSLVVSILSGLLAGMLPAASAGRFHELGTRGSPAARGSAPASRLLTATQVALTVILLAASLSVGRAFVRLMTADRGYDPKGIVTVNVSLEGTTHEAGKRQLQYFDEVLMRLRSLPGVRSASATEFLPLYSTGFIGGPFGVDGHRAPRNSTMIPTMGGYVTTMGGRLIEGRDYSGAEVRAGSRVAIVNERFAAAFGAPREMLGRQLTAGRMAWKIVGVAAGMEFETDPSLAHSNQVFVPVSSPGGFFSTFVAKVDGRAEDRVAAIRDAIRSVDPQAPVFGAKTMEQRMADFYIQPRFYRTAVWVFAAVATLLALIGMFGIVSHAVARRTREIGLRMAFGATPVGVRGMLLRDNILVVAMGACAGVLGSGPACRYLESLIPNAGPVGPASAIALSAPLAAAAAVTIWVATRRIPCLDIVEVIRTE